jgi:hypothetical protein
MSLPSSDTPLYNHPLPAIEAWLTELGCQQDRQNLHCWKIQYPAWQGELCLEVEELIVHYFSQAAQPEVTRSFKYSLSRQDIESAVFTGP